MNIAALDLGSNSFHLALAECRRRGSFTLTARHKEKVQLGRAVFAAGAIDAPAFERGMWALRKLRGVIDALRPERRVAVATSALREATNGADFLQQAERVLGFPVNLIGGHEEARYVALGALRELKQPGSRHAIVDLGGGSTEIIVACAEGSSFIGSLPLGTLRLQSEVGETRRALRPALLEERARSVLAPALARLHQQGFDEVVLSCGSARKLARLARALGFQQAEDILTRSALTQLVSELARPGSRAAQANAADPDTTQKLLAAACVFKALFSGLSVERALVSRAGLREGLIAEQLHQHYERAAVTQAVGG